MYIPLCQTYKPFEINLPKLDQYRGGMWLIHGTKHHKENQLQSLKLPRRVS